MRWTLSTGLAGLAALLLATSGRAQDYCVAGDFNAWDTSCQSVHQLLDSGDGSYERSIIVAGDSGASQAAYHIYAAASPSTVHGAQWSERGGAGGAKLLVFPTTADQQVTFFFDPVDRRGEGWQPSGPTSGDDWNSDHTVQGEALDGTARYWLARGDWQVGTGGSYFAGLSGAPCQSFPDDCAALRMNDAGLGWDETPDDGVFSFGLVVTPPLAGTTLNWRAATNSASGADRTAFGPAGWLFVQDGTPTGSPGTLATAIPADARGQLLLLEFDAHHGRLRGRLRPPPKLLLTELVVAPDAAEYLEIYNPNDDEVGLDDYYLSDSPEYAKLAQASKPQVAAFDFIARFPAGARIAPHTRQVIGLRTDAAFAGVYSSPTRPHYKLYADGSGDDNLLRRPYGAAVDPSAALDDAHEPVVLFYWDGISDLVFDVDYVYYGGPAVPAVFKTSALAVDSATDHDALSSTYQADTATATDYRASAPGSGEALTRLFLDETGPGTPQRSACPPSDAYCNGIDGSDETSESTRVTWRVQPTPRPGAESFLELGAACSADAECRSNSCGLSPGGSRFCVAAGELCATDAGAGLGLGDALCAGGDAWTCNASGGFDVEACDDGLACTADSCALGICDHVLAAGQCALDGACHADSALNPANACETCDASTPSAWTPVGAGGSCDDGVACNSPDQCNGAGQCVGTVSCGSDAGVADAGAADASDGGAAGDAAGADGATGADATPASDAAAGSDAAPGSDASTGSDAATGSDASTAADATAIDAAAGEDAAPAADSGVVADGAGGADADASPRIDPDEGACSCRGSGPRPGLAWLLVGLLGLGWRRRQLPR